MTIEARFTKKAVKVDAQGRFLTCVCGARVDMPQIAGMPMGYVCGNCGEGYDGAGWLTNHKAIVARQEGRTV